MFVQHKYLNTLNLCALELNGSNIRIFFIFFVCDKILQFGKKNKESLTFKLYKFFLSQPIKNIPFFNNHELLPSPPYPNCKKVSFIRAYMSSILRVTFNFVQSYPSSLSLNVQYFKKSAV